MSNKDLRASRLALKVALIYIVAAGAWILFSDELVGMFVTGPDERIQISIYKGWAFVLLTAGLLYKILRRALKRWEQEAEQRRQAEEARHDSEQKYRQIFDVATDAVFLVDTGSNRILDANPAAEKMYGYTRDELLRLKAADISAEPEQTKAAIAAKVPRIPSRLHRRKDGVIFPVEISCSEFVFQNRGVHVAAMRDITERKHVEAALQLSDFSVNHASLPTLWIAADARIVRVNAAACGQLGYTETEMLQLAITDLDPDVGAGRWPFCWQELREQKQKCFETRHRHKDGHLVPVEVSLNWFEFGGQEYNFAFARDITERQRAEAALRASEARLRKTLEKLPVPLWHSDQNGLIVFRNERFIETFGYTEADVPEISVWMQRAYPDPQYRRQVAEQWDAAVRRAVETGEEIGSQECKITCKSGEERAIEISGTSFGDGLLVTFMDLTARKLAEAALRESEFFFKESQRAARIGSYKTDFVSGFWESSEVLDQIFGIRRSFRRNVEGWLKLIHPDDRKMMEEHLRDEVLAKHQPFNREYRIIRQSDGETRWVSGFGEVGFNAAGTVISMIGTIQDVTERKLAEQKILESRATLEAALASMTDAVFISDTGGKFIEFNDAFASFHRFKTKAECAGSLAEYPAILEVFTADGRLVPLDLWAVPRALRGEVATNVEYHLRRKDIGEAWVGSASFSPIRDWQGTITGAVVVARDITESKRAAEKLARLAMAVEQAAETIVITDIKGSIVYVNPVFEKTTGYTRAEALGQNPRMLKSGKQDAEFYRQMWATIRRGDIWSGRLVNRRKDGALFEEELTISPIRDAAGAIVNYVAVKRDVTREVQLETEFRQAQKMEAIGTLAGGIAHDFNNILAAMFGYGYLLKEDVADNPAALENIGEILSAAGRAKELVQQILTFSRQREQKRQVVRLNVVVKEAVKFLRASLPAGIMTHMEFDAAAPAVLADPTQIYQVILNLATNAFQAMEGRNGALTISLQTFEPSADFLKLHPKIRPAEYARLMVADTGLGMDATTTERIFEPFFTTKPVGKGTGLGLSVVHGIVQSHDGLITVESTVGVGTTFYVYFPGQAEEEVIPVISPVSQVPQGGGQRILVVDDERSLTSVFHKLLGRLAYQVTTSNNSSEALEIFRKAPDQFDLVITDLTMPEMNGIELAGKIHQLRPLMPIVLASGFNAGLDADKAAASGICAIMEKPVSLAALSEALSQALGRKAAVGRK